MTALYLMFVQDGELAGLERGAPMDEAAARHEAARMLAGDADLAAVEIWSGGQLLAAVRD